jgi:DNA-binding MarR family transcriptional regulator
MTQAEERQPNPNELRAARAGCACNRLRQAAREITQRYERALAPSGVKATQFPILLALAAGEPIPLTPLADGLALDRTTLTRNLRILEGRGLVTVAGMQEDGRMRMVSITGDGLRVLAHALELWRSVQDDVVDEFGEARLRGLLGDLSDLAHAGAR